MDTEIAVGDHVKFVGFKGGLATYLTPPSKTATFHVIRLLECKRGPAVEVVTVKHGQLTRERNTFYVAEVRKIKKFLH